MARKKKNGTAVEETPLTDPIAAKHLPDNVEPDAADAEASDEAEEFVPGEMLGRDETRQAIYAMLFVSDRPLSVGRIAEALGDIDPDIVANLIAELTEEVNAQALPYLMREIAGGYQLTTRPEHAPYIRRLLKLKKSKKLTKTVLETLAIIAYRQPVTRPDVESIRGVSVAHAFEQLQDRRLIKAVGVAEVPGRPRLYRTTDEFLLHFGIAGLKELPSIEELREMG